MSELLFFLILLSQSCIDEDILDMSLFFHIDIYISIYTAIGHVINYITKWRSIESLVAVTADCYLIVLSVSQLIAYINSKCSVTRVVTSCLSSIYVNHCIMCHTVKCKKNRLALPVSRSYKNLLISADHLILTFIKIVQRCFLYSMWYSYRLHAAVYTLREQLLIKLLSKKPVIIQILSHPVTSHIIIELSPI